MSELPNQPDQIPAGGSAQSSSYRVSHSTATVAPQPFGPTVNSWDLLPSNVSPLLNWNIPAGSSWGNYSPHFPLPQ